MYPRAGQGAGEPAGPCWAIQWYETAIFLALAVILASFCFWRVRRRHFCPASG